MFRNGLIAGAHRGALAVATILTLATACGKDSATGPQNNLFGTFPLASVLADWTRTFSGGWLRLNFAGIGTGDEYEYAYSKGR